jgi:type II secretory pathway pseudopilin PulG
MTARRAGFTAVEAVVAVAIGAMVLGSAVAFLSWGTRAFARTSAKLDVFERAHLSLATLRATLADATRIEPTAGDALRFQLGERAARVVFDPAAGRVTLRVDGRREVVVVPAGAQAFAIGSRQPGLLRVTLKVGGRTFADDVLLPAVAARAAREFWND